MKNSILIFVSIFLAASSIFAQDVIFTVSGEINETKTALDSILVENLTNNTSILFDELPAQEYYQINLTKNVLWSNVSVFDIEEPSIYTVRENTPGLLSVMYGGNEETEARVSIVNVNGQVLYLKDNLVLTPHQLLQVKLGSSGLYFVKVESSTGTKTFKAIGSEEKSSYEVKVSDGLNTKSVLSPKLKSTSIIGDGDFTFNEGDGIRISVFNSEYYAYPKALTIIDSEDINFNFIQWVYADTQLEIAYPDSIGKEVDFQLNGDTLICSEINGQYIFQGDIVLTEEQVDTLKNKKGASISQLYKLWPDGIVYYEIGDKLQGDERISDAIAHWKTMTPIKFVERTTEPYYIVFTWHPTSCMSNLGMCGSGQKLWLADWGKTGSVIHEIGHAVGLIHEHSRTDREKFINIHYDNIIEEKKHNYRIVKNSIFQGSFDFNSIMIYSCRSSFAKDRSKPIITKLDGTTYKAQRNYLSKSDIAIIEYLYGEDGVEGKTYFTDGRDVHTYEWVHIGNQIWMAENLAYDVGEGCWSADKYDDYVATYGRLYNYEAAMVACPTGWHLPTDDEWKQLEMAIGMSESEADDGGWRGTNEGAKLKATSGWHDNGNGTDDYGFSALAASSRITNGTFKSPGYYGYWWSATEDDYFEVPSVWARFLAYYFDDINRGSYSRENGFCVRCVRD